MEAQLGLWSQVQILSPDEDAARLELGPRVRLRMRKAAWLAMTAEQRRALRGLCALLEAVRMGGEG
jgi:hypothetical protein